MSLLTMPRKLLMTPAERTFGVEIEVVGMSRSQAYDILRQYGYDVTFGKDYLLWSVVDDGSLDCNDCLEDGRWGCPHRAEIVSPILRGEEGLLEIAFVLDILKNNGAYTNHTCGTHVHVGARDIKNNKYAQTTLMTRYVGFGFDKAAGRVCDQYAPVYYQQKYIIEYVEECHKSYGDRYNAINLTNLKGTKGTVEFRQLAGTTDFNNLLTWICAVTNLVEEVKDAEGCYKCNTSDHQVAVCDECQEECCPDENHTTHCDMCGLDYCDRDSHTTWNCWECGDERCINDDLSDYHGNYCSEHSNSFCGEECYLCEEEQYKWNHYTRFMREMGHTIRN